MKRSRGIKKYLEGSESENERPVTKRSPVNVDLNISKQDHESSSESDIEDYLLKPEKLDLDSHFFNTNISEFEKVEKNIFCGITKLSDSESESDIEQKLPEQIDSQKSKTPAIHGSQNGSSSKMHFKQLQDYTKKIEEAKKQIEIYKARKQAVEKKTNILNLLATGEGKLDTEQTLKPTDLHSSDFESGDSEQEDWEEIKTKGSQENQEKNNLPQGSLQITVDMPSNVKKKKGVDLLAAMKRRLNRIRKENQVLVHKVHLLCWLAHGNYFNSSINATEILAMALSLLPSEQCYPSDRIDLSYLEQIVNWYKRTIKNIEKPVPESISLDQFFQLQIGKKAAYNKKMLACIFIAVLRALGIQSRLVMSLQVEPLRPPVSELHTISTKSDGKKESSNQNIVTTKSTSKTRTIKQSEVGSTDSKRDVKPVTGKGFKQKNSGNENVDSKAAHSKSISDLKIEETISTKIKSNKPKSNGSTSIHGEDKTVLKKVKSKAFSNIKGSHLVTRNKVLDITPKKREIRKDKGTDSKNLELSLKYKTRSKKRDIDKIGEEDEIAPNSSERLKDLGTKERNLLNEREVKLNIITPDVHKKNIESKRRIKDNESPRSKNETKGKTSKSNLQIKKTIESKDIKPKIKSRTRSMDNKDSASSVKSNTSVRKITKKSVTQVDGIHDSDSELETVILQLDGANDNDKKSKNNVSSGFKMRKKSSKAHSVKKKPSSEEDATDSESEFEPTSRSLVKSKSSGNTPNLKKLTVKKRLSSPVKKMDVRDDIMSLIKNRITQQKQLDQSRLAKKRNQHPNSDSDSDYIPEPIKKKHHESDDDFVPKIKVKRRVQIPRKGVLSDSENEVEKNKKKGNDVWVEVFLEAEEKWISVDVIYGQVHCVKEIYQRATHPVSYIVAWDNNNKLKDVTQRYCQNFNTITRKQRVDAKWWNDSLKPFMGIPTARDKEEDGDLARQQLDQPLPKAISEYKNHPFYVLRRHLLKFEGLYPPEPPTLGFIRGEAVYPRTCVYILHSRDIWLKQAKVVKLGEQPYKIVKARPKYDRLSNKIITDQLLEIFGPWQVQDYEPPTAENGMVPKNAFGNVDLFKPCMLPKGCVHLKLPGLNKIARKMNIDIASAIVGFDFHGGWSHPVYDGFVACKEYEDQLICAWELEQDELEKKEEEKINRRVYGNWKKLIKGLLIRERLKAKYDFGEPSTSNPTNKRNKTKS